jgi:hypothetical protein
MRIKDRIEILSGNLKMRVLIKYLGFALVILATISCDKEEGPPSGSLPDDSDSTKYPGVPLSDIYEVTITRADSNENITVFKSTCPEYKLGEMDMVENDLYPLGIFAGRSISWCNFSFSGSVTVEVKVLDQTKVPVSGEVKILPSRYGISPVVEGNVIRFVMNNPGQCSVEIGSDGYKNGLMVFADPDETDIPDISSGQYAVLEEASKSQINAVSSLSSGIYFKSGVHNIGVYQVPANIKNIYLEQGSWVYGALVMDGNPDVRIFGRGVLSSGKLNYRESHCIEAINQSNNIQVEGIVVADPRHFAVRLIGTNNTVSWTKVIGGWVYNCDGIAAYAGSDVSNCFIWANDDAIKVYRDDITWSDCVVWQLNNGGVIQMSWGGSVASNVTISRIDVLRAEWNKPLFNRALLSCVGNRYQTPGKYGLQQNWLIEDIVTETPIPVVFNITPDEFTFNHIHNLTLKNWDVKMTMNTNYQNMIIGNDPDEHFDGFVFDNFIFNGTELTESNWIDITESVTENLVIPVFL